MKSSTPAYDGSSQIANGESPAMNVPTCGSTPVHHTGYGPPYNHPCKRLYNKRPHSAEAETRPTWSMRKTSVCWVSAITSGAPTIMKAGLME